MIVNQVEGLRISTLGSATLRIEAEMYKTNLFLQLEARSILPSPNMRSDVGGNSRLRTFVQELPGIRGSQRPSLRSISAGIVPRGLHQDNTLTASHRIIASHLNESAERALRLQLADGARLYGFCTDSFTGGFETRKDSRPIKSLQRKISETAANTAGLILVPSQLLCEWLEQIPAPYLAAVA